MNIFLKNFNSNSLKIIIKFKLKDFLKLKYKFHDPAITETIRKRSYDETTQRNSAKVYSSSPGCQVVPIANQIKLV